VVLLEASSKKKGGDSGGGVTHRMKSQDLMHAFLEQNRPWMLQNLANIFTSEFLARNPPWIVREMAKTFGITPGFGTGSGIPEDERTTGKATIAADISSDEGSDASEEMPDFGKMDHLLTNAVHKVALKWLSYVRKEEVGKYEISSDSEADDDDGQYEVPMITEATKDITELWMRKVAKYLRAERIKMGKAKQEIEISSDEDDDSDAEFGHLETLNEVTMKIAMKWLEKIRGRAPPKTEAGLRADISSDESEEEEEGPVKIEYEPAVINDATTRVAFRWLRSVQQKRRPLVRVDISSDSEEEDEPNFKRGGGEISSDDEDDEDGGDESQADMFQVPSTKAVAYKWLGRVRRVETKSAWEEDAPVENVALNTRLERKKPKAKGR